VPVKVGLFLIDFNILEVVGGLVYSQKIFSVNPRFLSDVTTAAENGVFQHRSIFPNDVRNSVTHQKVAACDF
jgi:hypothetical protein